MVKKGENIYKRKDGRWEGRYIKERKLSGGVKYGYIYGKKYADVKLKLIIKKAEFQIESSHVIYDGTISDWFHYWLKLVSNDKIKQSTYSGYYHKVNLYILPFIGSFRFEKLTSKILNRWIKQLTDNGLSPSSIRTIVQIFKGSLNQAVRKGYLATNYCENLELPKIRKNKVRALSKKEQTILEIYANKQELGLPIILSLYTGMRIGEISGLKWSDIDLNEKIILVEQTLQRISTNGLGKSKTYIIRDRAKTSSSQRKIPFSDNLLRYLLKKREKSESEYVVSARGRYVEPRTISNQFKKIQQQAGLHGLHFHMLRHTFVTRCLEEGVDIASVSSLLGHASAKMTLDIYADSLLEQRQNAMNKVDKLMNQIK